MMDTYQIWLYAHVLMFVYWLGADLGVFTLALALKNLPTRLSNACY